MALKKPDAGKSSRKKDILLVALILAVIIILLLPWVVGTDSEAKRKNDLEKALLSLGERDTVAFSTGDRNAFFVRQGEKIVMDIPIAQMGPEEQAAFAGAVEGFGMTTYFDGVSYKLEFLDASSAVEGTDNVFINVFGKTKYYSAVISTSRSQ